MGEVVLVVGILEFRVGGTEVYGEVDMVGGRVMSDGPPHVTLYGADVTTGTAAP